LQEKRPFDSLRSLRVLSLGRKGTLARNAAIFNTLVCVEIFIVATEQLNVLYVVKKESSKIGPLAGG